MHIHFSLVLTVNVMVYVKFLKIKLSHSGRLKPRTVAAIDSFRSLTHFCQGILVTAK